MKRKKGSGNSGDPSSGDGNAEETISDLIDPESGLLPDGRAYEEANRKEPCPICMKPVSGHGLILFW